MPTNLDSLIKEQIRARLWRGALATELIAEGYKPQTVYKVVDDWNGLGLKRYVQYKTAQEIELVVVEALKEGLGALATSKRCGVPETTVRRIRDRYKIKPNAVSVPDEEKRAAARVYLAQVKSGEISMLAAAKKAGVTTRVFYNLLKEEKDRGDV
jgi:hypothetical protein